jgi:aspartate 1-decarboxylase
VQRGDRVILITYGQFEDAELADFAPTVVFVDDGNRIQEPASRRIA